MKYLFLLFFLHWTLLNAQSVSQLTAAELREDFDHLVAGLERYNPTMYAYISKDQFRQVIAEIKASINGPLTSVQLFQLLCLAAEEVDEAHITIGTEQDAFYKGFLQGNFRSLPLSVKFLGERAYVWNNLSENDRLERGDEILRINGKKTADLRAEIFRYTISDGDIETFKQTRLSNEFAARYFWFVEQPDSFNIVYKKQNEQAANVVTLNALTRREMTAWSAKRNLQSNRPKGINKVYSLVIENRIAILTLRSFNEQIIKENELDSYAFYERIFKRLRQNRVTHLILDVRDNIGGMKEFADDLLAFALKKNKKGSFRDLTSWDGKVTKAYFPKRNKWFFKGDWIVLTNGGTYSTASLIAQYLQEYVGAKIVGAETGSRYEGFAAGTYHLLTLPNSKIKIGIPNKWVQHKTFPVSPISNRGVMPTHPVTITIDNLLQKQDVIKEKALKLIQKNQ